MLTPDASIAEQRLTDVLEELSRAELARERVGPDSGKQAWLLDHDYLMRPVLDAGPE